MKCNVFQIYGGVSKDWIVGKQHGGRGMCSVRTHGIQHLKQRIGEVVTSATADIPGRVWREMEGLLDVCRATYGAHLER
jgi:hypothetical protein